MTAINVFIDSGRAHLFTDTGQYEAVTLRLDHLAPKAWPLAKYNAVLAWSGPADAPHHLLEAIERAGYRDYSSLFNGFSSLVSNLGVIGGYTAFLVDPKLGIAVEETGKMHVLTPGSFLKSLSSPLSLDPDDVKGSAVALMESQRASGVVFGRCLYYLIEQGRITVEELHDWGDRPPNIGAVATVAAKIGDLQVTTLKLADGAVTTTSTDTPASVSLNGGTTSTASVTILSVPAGAIVELSTSVQITNGGGNPSGSYAMVMYRNGVEIRSKSVYTLSGTGPSYEIEINRPDIVPSAGNVTYSVTLSSNYSSSPGNDVTSGFLLVSSYARK